MKINYVEHFTKIYLFNVYKYIYHVNLEIFGS